MKNKKFDLKALAIMGIASGAILVSQVGEAAPTNNATNNQSVYLAGNGCGNGSCKNVPTTNRSTQDNQRNQKDANPHAQPSYPANYSQSSFQYKNNNSLTALNEEADADLSKKTKIAPSKPITPNKSIPTKTNTINRQNLSNRTQSQKLNNNNRTQRPLALVDDSDTLPKSGNARDINSKNSWNNAQPSYPKPGSANQYYNKNTVNDDDLDDDDSDDEDDIENKDVNIKGNVKGSVPMPASKPSSSFQKSSYSRNSRSQPSQRQTAMNDSRDEDADYEDNNDNNSSYRTQRNARSNSLYNRNSYRNTTR